MSSILYKSTKSVDLDDLSPSEEEYQREIVRRMKLVLDANGVPPNRPFERPRNSLHRVAVVSDIHSNDHALDAVLRHAKDVDDVWCLGDINGYGPHPQQVAQMLRGLQGRGMLQIVAGNHDHAICGDKKIEWFNDHGKKSIYLNYLDSNPEDLDWVHDLPSSKSVIVPRVQGIEFPNFSLGHGSVADTDLYRPMDLKGTSQELLALDSMKLPGSPRHSLIGHSHVPALSVIFPNHKFAQAQITPGKTIFLPGGSNGPRAVINPGSVGQPRDQDPRSSYMTIDFMKNGETGITPHKIRYDAAPVYDALEQKGYPEFNRRRILLGH